MVRYDGTLCHPPHLRPSFFRRTVSPTPLPFRPSYAGGGPEDYTRDPSPEGYLRLSLPSVLPVRDVYRVLDCGTLIAVVAPDSPSPDIVHRMGVLELDTPKGL